MTDRSIVRNDERNCFNYFVDTVFFYKQFPIIINMSVAEYREEFTEMTNVAKTMIPLMRDMDGNYYNNVKTFFFCLMIECRLSWAVAKKAKIIFGIRIDTGG